MVLFRKHGIFGTGTKPAWVFGMAALFLLIAACRQWPSLHPSAQQPALVWLHATRCAESPTTAEVAAREPLILMLDLTGVEQLSEYKLEIVDEGGHQAFLTHAVPGDNNLRLTVPGLLGGWYYVRVYGPQELLREYNLEVRYYLDCISSGTTGRASPGTAHLLALIRNGLFAGREQHHRGQGHPSDHPCIANTALY